MKELIEADFVGVPERAGRAALRRRLGVLTVVLQPRERLPLARLHRQLDVRIGREEHAFLQIVAANICHSTGQAWQQSHRV